MEAAQAISLRNKIIGVLVKQRRLKAGVSQRECADFLGCSTFMFRQYEQGERGISLPELEALAYHFDVPVVSLWDDGYELPEESEGEVLPVEQLLLLRRKMLARICSEME